MTTHDNLKTRLLADEPIGMLSGCCDSVKLVNPDGPAADARIEALEAALLWYAETLCEYGTENTGCGEYGEAICHGCKARALFKPKETGDVG